MTRRWPASCPRQSLLGYDNNRITIEATQASPLPKTFRHDFSAMDGHVLRVGDANDVERIVKR